MLWRWLGGEGVQNQEPSSTATGAVKVDSTGRRNTFNQEVFMGRPAGWMKQFTGRDAMRSPGAPSHRREIEHQFWLQIAKGITSEKAAEAVGASQAVESTRLS